MPGEIISNQNFFEKNKLFPQQVYHRYQALVERANEIIEKEGGDENGQKALHTEIFQKLDALWNQINDFGKQISSSDVTILLNEIFRNEYYTALSNIILLLQQESHILSLKNHSAFRRAREDDLQVSHSQYFYHLIPSLTTCYFLLVSNFTLTRSCIRND